MGKLSDLEPKEVFHYFEELCSIPHGSQNMKQISDYFVSFAQEQQLDYTQDEALNVIITKPATQGYENAPAVIIQGHMDMVCEKAPGHKIDFEKDGLDLEIDGDYIFAKGTTLGGDDGIAIAYALAILADKTIQHPRLECVFTVNEEIGLLGASALDTSELQGKYMLNIDSEEEGILTVGCAGGLGADCSLPITFTEQSGIRYNISLEGLLGGHSGVEIHKERGNSNKLMSRLMCRLDEVLGYGIIDIKGGLQDNAIPRQTTLSILIDEEDTEVLESALKEYEQILKKEYGSSDPGVCILVQNLGNTVERVITPKSKMLITYFLNMVPNGVVRYSVDIAGLVQTSLNLGILYMDEEELHACFSVRSSIESEKTALSNQLKLCVEFLGGDYQTHGVYPEWEYKKESVLRTVMTDVYKKMYGAEPKVEAIHAGLECGIFSGKLKGLDCVSFGPDMKDIHTHQEKLSISSTKRVWEYTLKVLESLK